MAAKKERAKKPAPRSRRKHPEATRSQLKKTAGSGEIVSVEVTEKHVQEAATEAVSKRTAAMIENLAKKAAAGDAVSINALLELMRGKKQPQSKPRKKQADLLALPLNQWTNEREWKDPDKPNSKTAAGNK